MINIKNNLIEELLLDKREKRIFVIFLEHEKLRHLKDIEEINKTIRKLRVYKDIKK